MEAQGVEATSIFLSPLLVACYEAGDLEALAAEFEAALVHGREDSWDGWAPPSNAAYGIAAKAKAEVGQLEAAEALGHAWQGSDRRWQCWAALRKRSGGSRSLLQSEACDALGSRRGFSHDDASATARVVWSGLVNQEIRSRPSFGA